MVKVLHLPRNLLRKCCACHDLCLTLRKCCACREICTVPCESSAPATKSVPDLCLPRNLYRTLRTCCACCKICTWPCESAAPATKPVPDLAKVLRVPRNEEVFFDPRKDFVHPLSFTLVGNLREYFLLTPNKIFMIFHPQHQPGSQPVNQPASQSTNQPTYQPTNLPTYQPTNPPTYHKQTINQTKKDMSTKHLSIHQSRCRKSARCSHSRRT